MTTTHAAQKGSSSTEGELWGERARDFATQEPNFIALYQDVLDELEIRRGTLLLDVGCGTGLFLKLAEQRGAMVSGIDTAAELLEIARKRIPAAELVVGEMEQLPFADRSFDVVTSLSAYESTTSPDRALTEAARVAATDARVVISTWGRPEQCEAAAFVTELGALLPPPPKDAPGPFALSETEAIERLAALGGLIAGPRREVLCVWDYADETALLRALTSTRLAVRAINIVGEAAARRAILGAVAPFRLSDGSYRLENVIAYVVARASRPVHDPQEDTTTTRLKGHLMPTQSKTLDQPEETRSFENGRIDLVEIAGNKVGRSNLEPGWRWSTSVKPIVGTDSCRVAHVGYAISGRLHVRMDDGTELDINAGDVYELPPGHDAWVEGDEPFRGVEFESLAHYATH